MDLFVHSDNDIARQFIAENGAVVDRLIAKSSRRCKVYNAKTNTFNSLPSLNEGRRYHSCTQMSDTVYVYGGEASNGMGRTSVEFMTFGNRGDRMEWERMNLINEGCRSRFAFYPGEHDGTLIILGGQTKASLDASNCRDDQVVYYPYKLRRMCYLRDEDKPSRLLPSNFKFVCDHQLMKISLDEWVTIGTNEADGKQYLYSIVTSGNHAFRELQV